MGKHAPGDGDARDGIVETATGEESGKERRARLLAADRQRRRAARGPDLSRQDNTLIGTTADELLAQMRRYLGDVADDAPFSDAGLAAERDNYRALADVAARLDSWMSRGYEPPADWKRGHLLNLRGWAGSMIAQLNNALVAAQRLDEELRKR